MVTRSVDNLLAAARSGIERVTPDSAHALVQAGALLIDIRPIQQRREFGIVPDALRIERNVLEWRLDPTSAFRISEATGHDRTVLVLCQQGYASSFAAASLRELGYARAGDVIGGFDAWCGAGLPVGSEEDR
ncbi:MAG TPA: rhodanese-like domain-containing protein [Polyangiales bacterium]|jgi:rhodanese-related sulfurtransferase